MFNEMDEIQETVSELSENKWGWIKKELVEQIQRWCQEGGDYLSDDEFMDIDDDEEEMGIDQSYANGDKIMKNQLNSLYGQLEGIMAYHWMNYLNIGDQAKIQHKLNHGSEKRVGKYLVDGWDSNTNTIYQYQECYFHGHQCNTTAKIKDQRWIEERDKILKKTLEISTYLQEQGYTIIKMWECEIRKLHNIPQVRKIIIKGRPTFYKKHTSSVNESQILKGVRNDDLFGTPRVLLGNVASYFVTRKYRSNRLQNKCNCTLKNTICPKKTSKLLMGRMKAQKILIAIPLLSGISSTELP